MSNNLKKEIEKIFDKENNYNSILSKVERENSIKKFKIKYALLSIGVIIFAIILFKQIDFLEQKDSIKFNKSNFSQSNNISARWKIKEVESSTTKGNELSYVIPPWNKMPITEQFYLLEYNSKEYNSKGKQISADNVGKMIGKAVLNGHDTYTDTIYTKNANLYEIKNISDKVAIAVQFENTLEYYSYVNMNYKIDNLGQLIEDLNLRDNVSFGTVNYNYFETDEDGKKEYINIEFQNVSEDIIWKMLFNDISLKNEHQDSHSHNEIMGISISLPLIGVENMGLTLNEDGYIFTNLLGLRYVF